jgi:hypothetical protein
MSRDKKITPVATTNVEKVLLKEQEKAVLRNVIGQFDQAIEQHKTQIAQIEAQKNSQMQLFAQLTGAATGKPFNLAEYAFEGEDIFLNLTL